MERRFDMSEFEQSLKDHADQFSLTPSKRVWNGIYNNLHPGSKWPSITVAVVFLITLIFIGNLNNSPKLAGPTSLNDGNASMQNPTSFLSGGWEISDPVPLEVFEKNAPPITKGERATNPLNKGVNSLHLNPDGSYQPGRNDLLAGSGERDFHTPLSMENLPVLTGIYPNESKMRTGIRLNAGTAIPEISSATAGRPALKEAAATIPAAEGLTATSKEGGAPFQDRGQSVAPDREFTTPPATGELSVSLVEFSPVENSEKAPSASLKQNPAIVEKPLTVPKKHKKNPKIGLEFYVTPSISTVYFRGKRLSFQQPSGQSSLVTSQNPRANSMIYNARIGYETGIQWSYQLSKRWQLLTGLGLNYGGYNVISNLLHPTYTTLVLTDGNDGPYTKGYITHYGDGQSYNQVSLVNYSFQVSMPFGLQYSIWQNKNIQVGVASTLAPLMVVKSNSYIISSDQKYYVNDPNLMRDFNLSGNFRSMVTFTSRKVKWHVGPDIHYQLLSTYKNIYPVKEHLINYGIRIGISK